jgi:hypothetical protein
MEPQTDLAPAPTRNSRLDRFRTKMFDQGGLEEIFRHVRNIVTSSFIMAAGVYAVKYQRSLDIWGVFNISSAGYGVAALGIVLFLLNLLDGMHQLAKFRWHVAFQVLLVIIYLMITIRVEQIVVSFRTS